MKPILLIVNVKGRIGITGLSLSSIIRNVSELSNVVVVEDGAQFSDTWKSRWCVEWIRIQTSGVGQYAEHRLKFFLGTDHRYLLALDSDVLVSRSFDVRILNSWLLSQQQFPDETRIGTGFLCRLISPTSVESFDGYKLIPSVSGICQLFTKAGAQKAIGIVEGWRQPLDGANPWDRHWDNRLWSPENRLCVPPSEGMGRVSCTTRSVVEHIGIYEGINADENNVSAAVARDFDSDNSIQLI